MCSILVIDDEKVILQVIQEVLSKFGHDVEVAADGHEGIEKFADGSYDVVITDIRMPGIDGNEVVQYIRSSHRQSTPVIGISGTPWLLHEEEFDMVLLKPFPLLKLVESVNYLAQRHPSERPALETIPDMYQSDLDHAAALERAANSSFAC